jgi:hypothetical protein
MKRLYSVKAWLLCLFLLPGFFTSAQTPTINTPGNCLGVIANFNTNDNGFNSPSIYGSIFDSSLYYHAGRGYWTDYLPPFRVVAPGAPRVMNIISPPYVNPNPSGTFNVGFYYIVNNPATDFFQVRIISVTPTPQGTVTNVEATSGVQSFAAWSVPSAYVDGVTTPVPDPTPFMGTFQGFVCVRLVDPDIVNAPGTTFRVEVSYLINGPTFAVFDNLSIGPPNIPLPVNFIGLVANRNSDNSVDLKWDVSEEVNVKQYHIERSSSGGTFQQVGIVNAKGKSIYNFTNYDVTPNTVFYRVMSEDIDGKKKYSGILKLKGNAADSYGDKIRLYPVPATDQVIVEHKELNRDARLVVSSVDGRVVMTVRPADRSSHTQINISAMAPGIYFVKLDDGMGDVQTVKLIKN